LKFLNLFIKSAEILLKLGFIAQIGKMMVEGSLMQATIRMHFIKQEKLKLKP
jgi:hypothetical protein